MSKPKKDKSSTVTYKLEICYNPDTDTVEYLKESMVDDEYEVTYSISGFDIFDYWDEESLSTIESSYIVGES